MFNKSNLFKFTVLALLLVALFFAVPSAAAVDTQTGETLRISADEVIDDDLFAAASTFVLDGVVKGDLIVAGNDITINGVVEGDLMVAGRSIIINGEVQDDVRVAGAALELGGGARVGDDLLFTGASVWLKPESFVGGEVLAACAQALLAGEVAQDVAVGAAGVEVQGKIGGSLDAEVGSSEARMNVLDYSYTPSMPAAPSVPVGLTLGPQAQIAGDLNYAANESIAINPDAVGGTVAFRLPEIDREDFEKLGQAAEELPRSLALVWLWGFLRRLVAVLLIGLLLAWQFPMALTSLGSRLEAAPGPSAAWGAALYFGFPLVWFVTAGVVILLGILFALLSLGNLTLLTLLLGGITLSAVLVMFFFILMYLTKLVVGYQVGRWILQRAGSDKAENLYWALALGALVVVLLVEIPLVGWFFNFIVMLLGAGTLYLWWQARKPAAAPAPVQA